MRENAAPAALARFAVSNAPTTDRPLKERLRDAAMTEQMLHEFADAIVETRTE